MLTFEAHLRVGANPTSDQASANWGLRLHFDLQLHCPSQILVSVCFALAQDNSCRGGAVEPWGAVVTLPASADQALDADPGPACLQLAVWRLQPSLMTDLHLAALLILRLHEQSGRTYRALNTPQKQHLP